MCQSAAPLWAALCCSGSLPGAPLLLPLPRVGTQAFRSAGPRPKRKREVRVRSAPTRQRTGAAMQSGIFCVLFCHIDQVSQNRQHKQSFRVLCFDRLPAGRAGISRLEVLYILHATITSLPTSITGFPLPSLGAPARTQRIHSFSKAWTSGVLGQFRSPRFCRTSSFFSSSSSV